MSSMVGTLFNTDKCLEINGKSFPKCGRQLLQGRWQMVKAGHCRHMFPIMPRSSVIIGVGQSNPFHLYVFSNLRGRTVSPS